MTQQFDDVTFQLSDKFPEMQYSNIPVFLFTVCVPQSTTFQEKKIAAGFRSIPNLYLQYT